MAKGCEIEGIGVLSVLSLYIFRQLAQAFIILIGVLTALVWVSQAIRFLDLVIEKGRSIWEFMVLTGYLVPSIASLVAPTALFIATAFVLHRFNTDSELVVCQAAGGSRWRLMRPFAFASLLITGFIIFMNLYAMPHGMRAFREKLISVRTDLISTLVREGQFVSPESGLTVHIRTQDTNGDLLGLIFHDTRDSAAQLTYLAERARLISENGGTSMLMFNGTFQRRRKTAQDVDVVLFSEYTLDLSNFGPDRNVPYYEATEKYMSELLNPDPKDPIFLSSPGKIFAEIHNRLSSPFYAFAMMLIAFVGLCDAHTNRLGRLWMILAISGVAIAVRVLGATTINLMAKNAALAPLAYVVPVATILSALAFLAIRNRGQGPGSAFATPAPAARGRPRYAQSTVASSTPARPHTPPKTEKPVGPAAGRPAPATGPEHRNQRSHGRSKDGGQAALPERRPEHLTSAQSMRPGILPQAQPVRGPGPDPRMALRRLAETPPDKRSGPQRSPTNSEKARPKPVSAVDTDFRAHAMRTPSMAAPKGEPRRPSSQPQNAGDKLTDRAPDQISRPTPKHRGRPE